MKNLFVSVLLLFPASVLLAQEREAVKGPEMSFEKLEYNFGEIGQGETATHVFRFTNTGTQPVIISNASGSCGCTVPLWPEEPIMSGDVGEIKVSFKSTGKFGLQDKTVTITSNSVNSPVILHMKGNVLQKSSDGN